MNIPAYVIVNGLGAAGAGVMWYAGHRLKAWPRPAIVAVLGLGCGLVALKGILAWKPVWEAALFPFPWYVYLQEYWIVAVGAGFLGLVIPHLPAVRDRRALAALLVMVLVMGGFRTRWMVLESHHGQAVAPGPDHHLSQSTPYTCAPTACAIVLSYLGIVVTEEHLAELSLTRKDGTTLFNSYRGLLLALEGQPWTVHLVPATVEELEHTGRLAVIDFPEMRHALAIRGNGPGLGFTVHDPLNTDPKQRNRAWLASQYGGLALTIDPR